MITCFLGVLSVSIFPALAAKIGRKYVYIGGIGIMLMGFIVFAVAGQSVPMALVSSSIIFFPYSLVFLATLMTISDLVEYG